MRFTNLALVLVNVPFFALSTPIETHNAAAVQVLQNKAMAALREAKANGSGCSLSNAAVRKDW